MGHASCDITMNRYSHLMPETSQNAINALDNLFQNQQDILNNSILEKI